MVENVLKPLADFLLSMLPQTHDVQFTALVDLSFGPYGHVPVDLAHLAEAYLSESLQGALLLLCHISLCLCVWRYYIGDCANGILVILTQGWMSEITHWYLGP